MKINPRRARTEDGKATFQERRAALARLIQAFLAVQAVYMPTVSTLRGPLLNADGQPAIHAEDMPLYLPSALTEVQRRTGCLRECDSKELRIRLGRMEDGLVELQRLRRVYVTLCTKYRIQIGGQGLKQNTQARGVLTGMSARIARCVSRYRADRAAASALDAEGSWQSRLLPLLDIHVRGPFREQFERESRREQSWIWTVGKQRTDDADEEECNEHLRSEWARTRARSLRWKEEVLLCEEEMRRILAYFDWDAARWEERARSARGDKPADIQAGLRAYAFRKASQWRALARKFGEAWKPILDKAGLGQSWIGNYVRPDFVPPAMRRSRPRVPDESTGGAVTSREEEEEDCLDDDGMDGDPGEVGSEEDEEDEGEGEEDLGIDEEDRMQVWLKA